jgi:hypothetical protein
MCTPRFLRRIFGLLILHLAFPYPLVLLYLLYGKYHGWENIGYSLKEGTGKYVHEADLRICQLGEVSKLRGTAE